MSNDVAISETVRAQLSVLAETWSERKALTPRIRQCRSNDQPAPTVTLIEQDDVLVNGDTVPAGFIGAVLAREQVVGGTYSA
jgi:hypothetical protein